MADDKQSAGHGTEKQALAAPTIALPKGGGAIRGIGEKFAANPVTGTGALTVPLGISPGRSDFTPKLTLSHDSGAGNGPFGFGWSLGLPSITRKTDKGLPQYRDAAESDVYILAGAEDLVPLLHPDGTRFVDTTTVAGYTIHRYRPRIEGLFARIERWTYRETGAVHWRSITRENVTTLYGQSADSQIAAPGDPTRVFTWLICASYDDKGNAIVYRYAGENAENVDLTQTHEQNRVRTANRYVKRILYGNRVSRLIEPDLSKAQWLFEVVFDYDEGHYAELDLDPARPEAEQHRQVRATAARAHPWSVRPDPFSTYRAGFEVRNYRRCRRVLMFHHFAELGSEPCLVRSTEFDYLESDYSLLGAATPSGFVRDESQAVAEQGGVQYVTYLKQSLPPLAFAYSQPSIQDDIRELPPGSAENLPAGVDGTTYQWVDLDGEGVPGLLTEQAGAWFYKPNLGDGRFGPQEVVAAKPALANLGSGGQQLLDLAGDGRLDLAAFAGPTPGFYARTADQGWEPFRPLPQLPTIPWDSPHLRFVDLDGDGHADVLITEQALFTWYPSLAEEGFGPARQVRQPLSEEQGPRLVLADSTGSIFLGDMSGDGLVDLVRIRNGEVCYWPNLGYGRFGAQVTMENAPWFDQPDQFNPRHLRLADIDGSGTTDILYLGRDGVRLYFNQSGNRWGDPRTLRQFPPADSLSAVTVVDLLGNGTACLVWSSPLPGEARRPLRYIDLMGGQKPHLLTTVVNNLGAETHVTYAPSTKFYLADKQAGTPWVTRLPFPVHVVERVETYDRISGNRFVTRYAYHHGFFDGVEREFRGFGLVEQWDTEEFAALTASQQLPVGTNVEASSHVPPVHTRTWFHTGAYLGRDQLAMPDPLLPDTVLPPDLTAADEREACRALKGALLRQEVYALDGTDRAAHPYTVTEQNSTIEVVQRRHGQRHGVYFTHAREAIVSYYERNPADPRVAHTLTLAVDTFGTVQQSATIAYGRPQPDGTLELRDQLRQGQHLITYTENDVTLPVDETDAYRAPLVSETRTFELTGLVLPAGHTRFTFAEVESAPAAAAPLRYEQSATTGLQKRPIEQVRTLYRRNDLTGPLAPDHLESRALPFETYRLAFTPELLADAYAGRVTDARLAEGGYVHSQGDANWWIPGGRVFYSADTADSPAQELAAAQAHFFLPRRYRSPFHTAPVPTETVVTYDPYDLLVQETRDALDNRTTVGERHVDPTQPLVHPGMDYRVLQPALVMDANRNRTAVAFDALGLVVGSAVMGKPAENQGDSLVGFPTLLTRAAVAAHLQDPLADPQALLGRATARLVYDLFAYQQTQGQASPQPAVVASVARITHDADLAAGQASATQHRFSYSDGFGREIQQKVQAEPDGGHPRWVGSGWTVFNNKGKPVRKYEPFFRATHRFEFDVRSGVSPVLCYDPVGRLVATLHPDHTWEKVVFDSWRQATWDVSDTVLMADPQHDLDVGDFLRRLPDAEYLPTWHAQRQGGGLGPAEQAAARKAAIHAGTSTVVHFDALGRAFLTVAHDRFQPSDTPPGTPPTEAFYPTRTAVDIEGNQRAVEDARERIAMRYDYDMLGNRIRQASMEAGTRWTLADVTGKPLYAWDSRDHQLRTAYDPLRRPSGLYLQDGAGPALLVERTVYGETRPNPEVGNLRGRAVQHRDQAGVVTTDEYDFKGNLLRSQRQLAQAYKGPLDWSGAVPLSASTYTTRTAYDALGRLTEQTLPDQTVIRPTYNEASLLERVEANLQGAQAAGAPVWTPFVTTIDYDAKAHRTLIAYGNGARTTYAYDPLTFRLRHLLTQRSAADYPGDCPDPPPGSWPGCAVQNLHYTYDPVGNITQIRDDAQQTVYFCNQRVEPSAAYTYDALYRLIDATGREHLGLSGGLVNPPTPPDPWGSFPPRQGHPGDGNAVGTYLEQYVYDAVGNILSLQHRGSDPAHPGWTRTYAYHAPSLLAGELPAEVGKESNRLTGTTIGATTETYRYDGAAGRHGNMTAMPHLPLMQWDHRDQLQATAQQTVAHGTPETTWYVYDAAGQRVRKVTERAAAAGATPTRRSERIYLGGLELYREYDLDGTTVTLARETLPILDDKQRVALVETRTQGVDPGLAQVVRYQLGNHLGSASLELDQHAQIISYEEYTPYGSTSYQAVRSQTETPKRYRYTGKERDEESGLYYHGVRYYAPWLGRWVSGDPLGIADDLNLYAYVKNRPLLLTDATGAYGELAPLSKGGVTTTTHEDVKTAAAKYTASTLEFGFLDVAKWKSDPEYLMKFKERFVYENREIIKAAAAKYDLPVELVAGVAFNEIGGKDPIKPVVYWARGWVPGTDDKDKTSLGQQATQVRRAAESLGYDPKKLTDKQRDEIVKSLNDPSQSIFIAAKHLSDLRNVDNPGKAGKDLTKDDIKVIGARYNQGPDKALATVKKDLSYGEAIVKRWSDLGRLLTTAPAAVEYSPVTNNVVKPVNQYLNDVEWRLERSIKQLYGIP